MGINLSGIRGILFDLDGVLYVGDEVISGAKETLHFLNECRIACRFITNTSTRTAKAVAGQASDTSLLMNSIGLKVKNLNSLNFLDFLNYHESA